MFVSAYYLKKKLSIASLKYPIGYSIGMSAIKQTSLNFTFGVNDQDNEKRLLPCCKYHWCSAMPLLIYCML